MGGPATAPERTTSNTDSQFSGSTSTETDVERMKRGLSSINSNFSPIPVSAMSAGQQSANRSQAASPRTLNDAQSASTSYKSGGGQSASATAQSQAAISGLPYSADMTDYGTYAAKLNNMAGANASTSGTPLLPASIANTQQQSSGNTAASPSFGMHYPQSATTGLFPGINNPGSFGMPYSNSSPTFNQQQAGGMAGAGNGSNNTSPTLPTQLNQAFGLVGPAAIYQAAAMAQQQAQHMHQQQMVGNAFGSAQMSPYASSGPLGAGPPNMANLTASPSAQAMSAMSSFSGTGGMQSSNASINSANPGLSPLSPATAYTPNFASPLLSGNAFQQQAAALSAATAGMNMQPGMFGLGMSPTMASSPTLGMPGGGLGALGINYPMPSSPNMAQLSEMAAQAATTTPVIRTVYVGNLPGDASVDELLSQVRYGPIESVKILPDKSCAFISFLDPNVAAAFHSDAQLRKIHLHNQELRIGWGKPTVIPAPVMQAVQQHGATRNVYLGNLDDSFTEETLRDSLSRYGHIDQVKIVRDKNIGFVHFLSIANAIKVVTELPKEEDWDKRRVNYGKDRCAYVPRNQHQQQQHNQMAAAMAAQAASQVMSPFNPMSPMLPLSPMISPASFATSFVDPQIQYGNRTIYLGNLHPDTTCEDICNTIRGGILQEIRLMPEKHIAFVSFVLAESALALHQFASASGITIKNRRLKVGWGKATGACPPGIAAIVAAGGSRNVYIGNIDDFEIFTLDKIKGDLSEYGEIEQVNALPDKSCAFVNFTKISSAVKAIEALKQHEEYSRFKIAYGKDRVGNMARAPYQRRGPMHRGDQQGHHEDMRSPIIALTPHSDDNNSVQFNDPGYSSTSPQIDQAN